jgi:hypothetical protein
MRSITVTMRVLSAIVAIFASERTYVCTEWIEHNAEQSDSRLGRRK